MTNQSIKESGGGTCRRAFVGVTRRGKFWGKGCRQARKPVPPIVRSARSKQGSLFSRPPNHPPCTDRGALPGAPRLSLRFLRGPIA